MLHDAHTDDFIHGNKTGMTGVIRGRKPFYQDYSCGSCVEVKGTLNGVSVVETHETSFFKEIHLLETEEQRRQRIRSEWL